MSKSLSVIYRNVVDYVEVILRHPHNPDIYVKPIEKCAVGKDIFCVYLGNVKLVTEAQRQRFLCSGFEISYFSEPSCDGVIVVDL